MKRKNFYRMIGKTAFALSALSLIGGCKVQEAPTEPIAVIESKAVESEEVKESTDAQAPEEVKESTDSQASDEVKESTESQAIEEVKESSDAQVSEEVNESSDTDAENKKVTSSETGRKDGEQFEQTIMLEGMEEAVLYEHIRNEEIGFELDYECDLLAREKGGNAERLLSIYDEAGNPCNYLEVTNSKEKAEDAAGSISEMLSKDYDITQESCELEHAGSAIKIITVSAKENGEVQSMLQTVYIIPTAEGSLIATAHYTLESAGGFGQRFAYIVNTITPIK